ncbi:MAG: hypothetical protein OXF20_03095 [Gammaproteobacteria bacterium]|nr:hypothetical protein [Gammaproteobacteria bacterium]
MIVKISRKVREIKYSDSRLHPVIEAAPIENFRPVAAYVLLAPPGAGKTTTFREESVTQPGTYVTARSFNTFDDKPEWHDTTMFIDGLDEVRSGRIDSQTPFDKIRKTLYTLGCPNFRLSCREADWFGMYDAEQLKEVSPDKNIKILRLEPLSEEDIWNILRDNLNVSNPEFFILEAKKRGIQSLLTNPQSLEMLAHAVRNGGDWPETKTEVFVMACQTLLGEHNIGHKVSAMNPFSTPDLMEASGRICAVQLLTGASGFSQVNAEDKNGIISMDQFSGHQHDVYPQCLQSKLFESMVDGMAPVHRLVAEFLAARHVARLVDENGLPIGRFLSLVTGHDGAVVSELRGLVAWLGAQSRIARSEIIGRDSIGSVLYGDSGQFSLDDRCVLLKRLKVDIDNNYGSIPWDDLLSGFGEMITPEMENILREELEDQSREESNQSFVAFLLKALKNAIALKGLNKLLMQIVRDKTRSISVRISALEVLIRYRELDDGAFDEFMTLVEDIHNGKIQDHESTLLLYLLDALYPNVITEARIIEYLNIPANWGHDFNHEYFWSFLLPEKSTPEQLSLILDQLVDRSNQLIENDNYQCSNSFLHKFAGALLARILDKSVKELELDRLFDWLGLIMDQDCHADHYHDQNISDIQKWLERHPEQWKSLVSRSIKSCTNQNSYMKSGEFFAHMHNEMYYRLFMKKPADFGVWCLDQAIITEDAVISDWLLERVAECLHYEFANEGLSHQLALSRLTDFPEKKDCFLKALKKDQDFTQYQNRKIQAKGLSKRFNRPDWHDDVEPYRGELRENKAPPVLLHQLAKVYLGGYSGVGGNNPEEWLDFILRHDSSLVEDVLTGFRRVTERSDLPSYKEILRLRIADRTHYLAYPIMAGLEKISDSEALDSMLGKERIIRLVLAIYYSVPMWPTRRSPVASPPFWLNRLLTNHPTIVADVLVEFVVGRQRNRKTASPLFDLANTQKYEEVARLSTMTILEKFPVNCTSEQLYDLNYLLLSASKIPERDSLLRLVEKKIDQGRMNIAQKVHWLVAGLFFSPGLYASRLESYVSGRERRIGFLAKAVSGRFQLPETIPKDLRVLAISLLIKLLGPSYRPISSYGDSEEEGGIFLEMPVGGQVSAYINQLAKISSPAATDSIRKLLSNEKLRPWKSHLERAAYHQNEVCREDQFRHYNLQDVLDTLDNSSPANARDLAVLTYEKLEEINKEIRQSNTSDWRQYWNVDSYNRPVDPKPENACRDLLASKLRTKLEIFGIDVQPEGSYADSRRADIRVAYQGFHVPIEIKKSSSRDLWSAIGTQLISKYLIDPGSGGNGIYLVLWFGRTEQCPVSPPISGKSPTTAKELEEGLVELLPDDKMYNIHVCVADVAKPGEVVIGSNA